MREQLYPEPPGTRRRHLPEPLTAPGPPVAADSIREDIPFSSRCFMKSDSLAAELIDFTYHKLAMLDTLEVGRNCCLKEELYPALQINLVTEKESVYAIECL